MVVKIQARKTSSPCKPAGPKMKASNWAQGEIAYLMDGNFYTEEQCEMASLGMPGGLHFGATNHPVIILEKGTLTAEGQFYLVTTVSAYSSGLQNNFLPPWEQEVHRYKCKADFRSFQGSELYQRRGFKPRKSLQLMPGQSMPKPEASWVYAQQAYIVPECVLRPFTKARRDLRMTQGSHRDLMAHMARACRNFKSMLADHRIRVAAPAPIFIPASVKPGRTTTTATATTQTRTATTQMSARTTPLTTMSWAKMAAMTSAVPTITAVAC